jgi:predicted dehydrogenase
MTLGILNLGQDYTSSVGGALVVGLGSIGKRHFHNLATLGVRPLGVYTSGKGCQPIEDRQTEGAKVYHSYEKALADGYGLIVVANPTHLHLEYALQAVKAGSHVYLEKPVSHRADGIEELAKALAKTKVRLQVGCQLRFHPVLAKIKEWLDQGLIGKPLMTYAQAGKFLPDWHPGEDYRQSYAAQRDMGGGVALTLIHEIDYLQWLLGPLEVLSALGGKSGVLELDVEDHVLALIRSQHGCAVSLGLDYLQKPLSRGCKLVGTKGAIIADLAANQAELVLEGKIQEKLVLPHDWDSNQPYLDCMQDLLKAVEEGKEPNVPLSQGVQALRTTLKIKDKLVKAS